MTALRLTSCVGVAAIALTAGSLPAIPAQPPTKEKPAAKEPASSGSDTCRSAQLRLANMRSQISRLQQKIDEEQGIMKGAKGEARIDAMATLVDDLADDQKRINEKVLFAEALISGHFAQHIRDARNFEDLQRALQHCGLATELETIASKGEDLPTPRK
jgi:hypothetical protein